jgi:hypothetical protein
MREYIGYITRISSATFTLTYQGQVGEKQLTAQLISTNPSSKNIGIGTRVRIVGDWAGNLGAGALTTFTVREIEFLD